MNLIKQIDETKLTLMTLALAVTLLACGSVRPHKKAASADATPRGPACAAVTDASCAPVPQGPGGCVDLIDNSCAPFSPGPQDGPKPDGKNRGGLTFNLGSPEIAGAKTVEVMIAGGWSIELEQSCKNGAAASGVSTATAGASGTTPVTTTSNGITSTYQPAFCTATGYYSPWTQTFSFAYQTKSPVALPSIPAGDHPMSVKIKDNSGNVMEEGADENVLIFPNQDNPASFKLYPVSGSGNLVVTTKETIQGATTMEVTASQSIPGLALTEPTDAPSISPSILSSTAQPQVYFPPSPTPWTKTIKVPYHPGTPAIVHDVPAGDIEISVKLSDASGQSLAAGSSETISVYPGQDNSATVSLKPTGGGKGGAVINVQQGP